MLSKSSKCKRACARKKSSKKRGVKRVKRVKDVAIIRVGAGYESDEKDDLMEQTEVPTSSMPQEHYVGGEKSINPDYRKDKIKTQPENKLENTNKQSGNGASFQYGRNGNILTHELTDDETRAIVNSDEYRNWDGRAVVHRPSYQSFYVEKTVENFCRYKAFETMRILERRGFQMNGQGMSKRKASKGTPRKRVRGNGDYDDDRFNEEAIKKEMERNSEAMGDALRRAGNGPMKRQQIRGNGYDSGDYKSMYGDLVPKDSDENKSK